jgi:hypothetical protein
MVERKRCRCDFSLVYLSDITNAPLVVIDDLSAPNENKRPLNSFEFYSRHD